MPRGRTATPLEERFPGLAEKLGTMSDKALADEFGLSQAYVCHVRNARGVPPFAPPRSSSKPRTWRHEVFSELRGAWLEAEAGRSVRALAELLEYPPNRISGFASGNEGREPPTDLLLHLAQLTSRTLVFDAEGVTIRRRPGAVGKADTHIVADFPRP